MTTTLMIKEIKELPLTANVAIPPENPQLKGKFKAYAVMRSKDEIKELGERMSAGEFANDDEKLLREMYTKFEGLGDKDGPFNDEKSWDFVLHSKYSAQLIILLLNLYYEGHSEARQGNSGRPR